MVWDGVWRSYATGLSIMPPPITMPERLVSTSLTVLERMRRLQLAKGGVEEQRKRH